MDLQVLFNGFGLLVTSKPVGICSDFHPEDRLPSMELRVGIYFKKHKLLHRIDKDTTGLLMFGDQTVQIDGIPAPQWMTDNWHSSVKKTYLALISMPDWDNNQCSEPLIDDPGGIAKKCTTSFRVLQVNMDGLALVQCELTKGGRKHQIRKHLACLGSPIIGDTYYNGIRSSRRPGQLLHAWKLGVNLPKKIGWRYFQSPIPEDFKSFDFDWQTLDKDRLPVKLYC